MSNFIYCIACSALLAIVPQRADDDPAATDSAKLQGMWELPDQPAGSPRRSLEVKGSTFFFRADEKITRQVTATLHASKQPKAIDLKENGEDKPFLAIYKFEKDRLTLCIAVEKARPTDSRPTAFESKPGQVLATYAKTKR